MKGETMSDLFDAMQFALGLRDSPRTFATFATIVLLWLLPLTISYVCRRFGWLKASDAFGHLAANVWKFIATLMQASSGATRATIVFIGGCATIVGLQSCAAFMPTKFGKVTIDGQDWYCARWHSDIPVLGTTEGMVCERTEAELLLAERELIGQAPRATFKKVSQ
jgi:hypothetical protein